MTNLGSTPPATGRLVKAPASFNQSKIASLDYRNRFAVNAVRHQGYCGSCWIFSLISAI